jgi:hypothetical protein
MSSVVPVPGGGSGIVACRERVVEAAVAVAPTSVVYGDDGGFQLLRGLFCTRGVLWVHDDLAGP